LFAIITNYSGYVLKFVGDSVLAFFIPEDTASKNKKKETIIGLIYHNF
jgi:hypothetical protein